MVEHGPSQVNKSRLIRELSSGAVSNAYRKAVKICKAPRHTFALLRGEMKEACQRAGTLPNNVYLYFIKGLQ
jgi:hypothetical protein